MDLGAPLRAQPPQCSPSSWAKGSQPGLSLTLCFSSGFGGPSILLRHDVSKSPLVPQLGMKFKEQEWPGLSPWPPLQFQMLQYDPTPVPCHGLGSASPGDKDMDAGGLPGKCPQQAQIKRARAETGEEGRGGAFAWVGSRGGPAPQNCPLGGEWDAGVFNLQGGGPVLGEHSAALPCAE